MILFGSKRRNRRQNLNERADRRLHARVSIVGTIAYLQVEFDATVRKSRQYLRCHVLGYQILLEVLFQHI